MKSILTTKKTEAHAQQLTSLKLRAYGATRICLLLLLLLLFKPTSTKPQAEKTRLDIQNYGCNGNLLLFITY